MRIVDPAIVRPLLAEWEMAKAGIAAMVQRADAAGSPAGQTRLRRQADQVLRTFLERLRKFTVLDPACGSGNFLYLALHALNPSLTTRFEVCCLSMRWRAIIPRMALHVGCLCRIRGQTIIFLMPPGAGSAPST